MLDKHDIPPIEESKARESHFKAALAEKMYDEATAKLVSTRIVLNYLTEVATRLRTLLVQLPDRLSPRLAAESDELTIYMLIFREVEEITKEIATIQEEDLETKFGDESAKSPVIMSGKVTQAHRGQIHRT